MGFLEKTFFCALKGVIVVCPALFDFFAWILGQIVLSVETLVYVAWRSLMARWKGLMLKSCLLGGANTCALCVYMWHIRHTSDFRQKVNF